MLVSHKNDLSGRFEDRIQAFESIQTNWLRSSGKLADHWKLVKLQESGKKISSNSFFNITQIDLINEAIGVIKHSARFAVIMAEQILKDSHETRSGLSKEKIKVQAKNLRLKALSVCSQVSGWNADTFLSDPIYYLASQLGARYIPLNQNYDPLINKHFHGACYGHVMSWRDEIEATGKYLALPRLDKKTFHYQHSQPTRLIISNNKNSLDRWKAIEEMIDLIRDNSIYEIELHWQHTNGHSLGLRTLKTGEVEFLDVNYGLFVFKNRRSFKIWFMNLLSEYPDLCNLFYINSRKIGMQPDNASPTIPEIRLPEKINEKICHNIKDIKDNFEDTIKIIRYSAFVSVYRNDVKSQDAIYHQQHEIFISKRTSLHAKLAGLNQKSKKQIPDQPEMSNNNDHDDNNRLKLKAASLIQKEIDQLQNKKNHFFLFTVNLLIELKLKIINAHPSLTLAVVIDSWLSARSKEDKMPRIEIIYYESRTTYNFITHLMFNYQINSPLLKVLEAELLNVLVDILRFKRNKKEFAELSENIADLVNINPHVSFPGIIINIKNQCANNHSIKFFNHKVKREDKDINTLCKIMNNFQTDHAGSLRRTINSLKTLLDTMNTPLSNTKKESTAMKI